MRRIVVTGASRGLGLEFCRQYLAIGDAVIAVHRPSSDMAALEACKRAFPGTLHFRTLDIESPDEIAGFGAEIAEMGVDILVNNAGQIGPETCKGETGQNIASLDAAVLQRLFAVNATAPLLLTLALRPSLRHARGKAVVVGATMGIARETFGDYYGYRMSKAAAHIAFSTLARDLIPDDILAAIICPGWVSTDMGGPDAPTSPADSVRDMIRLIDALSTEHRGTFVIPGGAVVPH